ncbi:MAG: hypothetical protein JXR49_17290 [Acidobacteria bacterium]|nr:hypothetical protein [Acidobacteriota bacterium]
MPDTEQTISRYRTLSAIVDHTDRLEAIYKKDLEFGDRLIVTTRNSTYSIHAVREGLYAVSGGWFDRHGLSPTKVAINGCTWGGHAIKEDILAACGLHLEFENSVVTSRILQFQVIRFREVSVQ